MARRTISVKLTAAVGQYIAGMNKAERERGGRQVTDTPQYSEGGYLTPGITLAWLSADECLISEGDIRAGRWKCSRPGHPTATSDCPDPASSD